MELFQQMRASDELGVVVWPALLDQRQFGDHQHVLADRPADVRRPAALALADEPQAKLEIVEELQDLARAVAVGRVQQRHQAALRRFVHREALFDRRQAARDVGADVVVEQRGDRDRGREDLAQVLVRVLGDVVGRLQMATQRLVVDRDHEDHVRVRRRCPPRLLGRGFEVGLDRREKLDRLFRPAAVEVVDRDHQTARRRRRDHVTEQLVEALRVLDAPLRLHVGGRPDELRDEPDEQRDHAERPGHEGGVGVRVVTEDVAQRSEAQGQEDHHDRDDRLRQRDPGTRERWPGVEARNHLIGLELGHPPLEIEVLRERVLVPELVRDIAHELAPERGAVIAPRIEYDHGAARGEQIRLDPREDAALADAPRPQ